MKWFVCFLVSSMTIVVPAEPAGAAAAEPSFGGNSTAQAPAAAVQPATTQPAATQPAEEPPWPANVRPFSPTRLTMTDNWFGLGKPLRDVGVEMRFFWNHHYMAVLGGGRDTNSCGKPDATMDWFLTLDLDKMGLIPDADILVQAREQWGGNGSGTKRNSINPLTGATRQVNDDADGTRPLHIDQLWYRQYFFDRKIAIQIGHLDYQTIVDRNAYANSEDTQFMNEVLDNNPMFRTASQTGLGVAATIRPCDWYTLILGLGDADRVLYQSGFHTTFHDRAWFYSYMEHGLSTKIPTARGPLPGNYRFGMIYDPTQRTVWQRPELGLPTRTKAGGYGFYTSFDQMLFREGPEDTQGLGWFFRYAYRHGDLANDSGFFNNFWSTGLSYTGLAPTRDKDTLGIAMAQLIRSPDYRSLVNRDAGNETYYELYYAIAITPWLVITPDIQYIDNPGGIDGDGLSHAIAGGVRLRVTF